MPIGYFGKADLDKSTVILPVEICERQVFESEATGNIFIFRFLKASISKTILNVQSNLELELTFSERT